MRKIRLLVTLLCLWLGMIPTLAQSVMIVEEMKQVPHASVMAMYKNEFGSFEKPVMSPSFPYAVIRMHLEGNAQAVRTAKERVTLYMGQQMGVESRVTTYSNQILFLVRAPRHPMIYIDCGDGCERVLLSNMQQLQPNCLYDCKVRFTPEWESPTSDTVFVNQGPQYYNINLRVEPADAKVELIMLNGVKQECSVKDGVSALRLEAGDYPYVISADNYYSKEGVLHIPMEVEDIAINLQPKVAWLSIESDSTDLTDSSLKMLRVVVDDKEKKMSKNEIKKNASIHSLPLQRMVCDTGVYQLIIEKKQYFDYNQTLTLNEGDNVVLHPTLRPRIMNTFLLAEVGFALNRDWGVGLMFGQMYNGIGWYLKGRSNFTFHKPCATIYMSETYETWFSYWGEMSSEWVIDAGLVFDFLRKITKRSQNSHFGMYVGAGYGARTRYLETVKYGWMIYEPNSYSGMSVDVGVIGSILGLTLSAGVNAFGGIRYMEIEVGIGWTF